MKLISPKLHGIIDYLVVAFLLASPLVFGFTGLLAIFTYVLGVIHLALTLLTDFNGGVMKLIPLSFHGMIELIVGVVLIILAFTLFKDEAAGKIFYALFGAAVLLVWLLTDYRKSSIA